MLVALFLLSLFFPPPPRFSFFFCVGGNPSDLNPIISLVFVPRIMAALADMAEALGVPVDPFWRNVSTHMAQPQTAPWSGGPVWTFSEASQPTVPAAGQNPINLYPIFPSERVSLSSPPALITAALATLAHSDSWDQVILLKNKNRQRKRGGESGMEEEEEKGEQDW